MTDIYEILRGKKDADGNYQKKPVIVQGITCLLYTSPSPRDRG